MATNNVDTVDDSVKRFFTVVVRGQSYLNIIYLLLAFPLGVFYFVFLVTGLSVGLSLVIVWVGIPILILMFAAWWGLAAFERQLAIGMLRVQIAPMSRGKPAGSGVWAKLKSHLGNPVTWKSLAYLFIKFPLGIVSFCVAVTLISLTLALLTVPFYYGFSDVNFVVWQVDSLGKAIPLALVGIVLVPLSMHIMNALAAASGWLARALLGRGAGTVE